MESIILRLLGIVAGFIRDRRWGCDCSDVGVGFSFHGEIPIAIDVNISKTQNWHEQCFTLMYSEAKLLK
ncbi:MAG: hypothetical protein DRQ99_06735 [Candidatus Parabeggiatoa sp. nov. 3]|nr:MAG: hypothetical protein DRQ99_06735 [Gammaproteobacteria bacterium]